MHKNRTTYFIILVFTIFITLSSFAQEGITIQQIKIDSLTTILTKKSSSDTLMVNQMNELSRLLGGQGRFEAATS